MIHEFLGVTPVRPEASAGSDVRSEPEYEALNSEIEKMANPSAAAGTDWKRVAELASNLLASKGKDLQVACYLGAALVQLQQVQGLSISLQVLGDLVETYWDSMFPPAARIRGRRNALEWWLERTLSTLSALTFPPLPLEELETLKGRFRRFDDLMRGKDPEGPMFSRLGSFINGLSAQEIAKPATETPAQSGPAADLSGPIGDADKALELALERIAQIAVSLRDAEIANPLAYRLTRIAGWTQIEQVPPVNEGRTGVPAPPGQDIETLKSLRAGSEAEAVIIFAESRLSQYPFWLDLNRATSEGLARLGERGAGADAAVKLETANLLRRIPNLEGAAFADGTPFADAGTLAWLAGFANGSSNGSGPRAAQGMTGAENSTAVFEEARALADQGKFLEAIEALDAVCRETASERLRMLLRMRIGEMILANNSGGELRPYFAPLLETIDRFRLESWEPGLAVEALILIYRGLGPESEPGCGLPARTELLKRIALLDFSKALKLATA